MPIMPYYSKTWIVPIGNKKTHVGVVVPTLCGAWSLEVSHPDASDEPELELNFPNTSHLWTWQEFSYDGHDCAIVMKPGWFLTRIDLYVDGYNVETGAIIPPPKREWPDHVKAAAMVWFPGIILGAVLASKFGMFAFGIVMGVLGLMLAAYLVKNPLLITVDLWTDREDGYNMLPDGEEQMGQSLLSPMDAVRRGSMSSNRSNRGKSPARVSVTLLTSPIAPEGDEAETGSAGGRSNKSNRSNRSNRRASINATNALLTGEGAAPAAPVPPGGQHLEVGEKRRSRSKSPLARLFGGGDKDDKEGGGSVFQPEIKIKLDPSQIF